MKLWGTVAVAALVAGPALADESTVGLIAGRHGDFDRFGAYLRVGPQWQNDWGGWHASIQPELELSHMRHFGNEGRNDSLNEAGVLGVARMTYGKTGLRPYAEFGLGGTYLSHTDLGRKELSTNFQFSERLGVGLEISDRFSVGLRLTHFSNANIARPNNGLDFHEVVLGLKF